jgi:hypothetical protein
VGEGMTGVLVVCMCVCGGGADRLNVRCKCTPLAAAGTSLRWMHARWSLHCQA